MSIDLMPVPRQQFFDANGVPLAGGKLYFFSAGTSTPLATYTDISGTIQNSNPVILDSGGFASVWLGAGPYRVVLKDKNDVQQWVTDNVTSSLFGPTTTDSLQNKTLNGPNSNNQVNLLNFQGPLPFIAGNGNDQAVAAFTLAPNVVAPNKGIRLTLAFTKNGGGAVIYKVKFSSSTATVTYPAATQNGITRVQMEFFNVPPNSVIAQSGLILGGVTILGPTTATSALIDFTVPNVISFTMSGASTETVALNFWLWELLY